MGLKTGGMGGTGGMEPMPPVFDSLASLGFITEGPLRRKQELPKAKDAAKGDRGTAFLCASAGISVPLDSGRSVTSDVLGRRLINSEGKR